MNGLRSTEAARRSAEAQQAIQSAKEAQLRAQLALSAGAQPNVDRPSSTEDSSASSGESAQEFARIEIDSPHVDGLRVKEPLPGMLSIGGWAIATSGVAEITVQIDDNRPAPAFTGIRRPDVAAAFPNVEGAYFSGFGLVLTPVDVGLGEHVVRVAMQAKSGHVTERVFAVSMEQRGELGVRHRVPQAEVDQRTALLRQAKHVPFYSVVILVEDNADSKESLTATLASLRGQAYQHWHATVIDNTDRAEDFLRTYAIDVDDLSDRISVRNSARMALEDVLGDAGDGSPVFLTVLTPGECLGADALLEFAVASSLEPSGDFFYADERRLDPLIGSVQPWLKPEWSPELLLSMNYIGNVWAAASELVRRACITLGDVATFGMYDTVLRLSERAARIAHVPKLLSESAPPARESRDSDAVALARAMARRNVAADVLPGAVTNTWRVRRVVDKSPLVSIIIPTCGARDLIKSALRSIRENTEYAHVEIVCLDNIPAERQQLKAWLRENADRVVDLPGEFNWSRFNNLGAEAASGDFLLFLNDDIEVSHRDWLLALLEHAHNPEVGVVGARLLYPNGTLQHGGMFLSMGGGRHAFRYLNLDKHNGPFGMASVQRNVIAVTGACQMMRRTVFESLGGFDERHGIIKNDVDFCLRAWSAGYRVVYTPFATLTHHELVSRGRLADSCDERAFREAWGTRLSAGDPFFNAALLPDDENYIADPEPVEILYAGNPRANKQIKRILVVKLDHIGDFILSIPALRRLKECFPAAEITLLAAPASCALAVGEPSIDHCVEFSFFNPKSELGLREIPESEMAELQSRLTSLQFDLAVDFRMHTETRPILAKSGANVLAGFDRDGLYPWLDIALEWEGDVALNRKRAHITDRLRDLVSVIDGACNRSIPTLRTTSPQEALKRVRRMAPRATWPPGFFDKPLVCIHAGVGTSIKRWPLESYAAFIDLLVEREPVSVILIGSDDEVLLASELAQKVSKPDAVVSLAGRVSLSDLPVLLKACVLFVGNDSGPKHIAAAVGIPTVGIHSSNVDAAEWAPIGENAVAIHRKVMCGPCFLADPKDCSRSVACLTGIRPQHVYRACLPFLHGLQPRRPRRKASSVQKKLAAVPC